VRDAFFDLATVEEEIRRDASRYAEDNLTPEQFAVRIRKIPGLAITAKSKMRDAKVAQVGYEGEHPQTIKFRRYEPDWLETNWNAASDLLAAPALAPIRSNGNNYIKVGVDPSAVTDFLSKYQLEQSRDLRRDLVLAFIDKKKNDPVYKSWNVVVIGGPTQSKRSQWTLGPIGHVPLVNRSPLQNSGDIANIKALMSRGDLLADFETVPAEVSNWDQIMKARNQRAMPPMVILYPIDRNSAPSTEKSKKLREEMKADGDILGLSLVFPGEPGSGTEYVQADIQPEDAEEELVGEDALPEELVDVSAQ
jgi:hypothetical protein